MRKFDCVLFDLDGTLLNTLADLTDAVNATMRQMGCPERTAEEVRTFIGNGIKNLLLCALPFERRGEIEVAYACFCGYYAEHAADKTTPYDGVREMCARLQQKGLRLGVVSNKADFASRRLIEKFFPDTFSFVLGQRDDVPKKPAPDGVRLAMEALGAEKGRTLYVGDSDVDFYTAQNAGIAEIAVSWGYRQRESLQALPVYALCDGVEELERRITEEI